MPILEGPERDYIVQKLTQRIAVDVRGFFVAQLQDNTEVDPEYLAKLPDIAVPKDLATSAIQMALAEDGRKYKGAFSAIVKGIGVENDTKLGELLKKFETYTVAIQVVADPYTSHFLAQKLPFWNRALLRVKLRQVKNGRSILLVNGEPKSGRSYTLQLLTHLALSGEPMKIAPVLPPVDSTNKTELKPALLAESIVEAMELEPSLDTQPGQGGKSKNQYYERLARWVLEHLPADNTIYWIVVDGIGLEGVDPDCRDFLARLAWKISAGAFQPRLRLILIDFPADDLDALSDVVEIDIAALPSDSDISNVVKAALEQRNIPFNEADIERVLALVQSAVNVPPTDPAYMRMLNKKMREILNA
jgi:hypothetical protein